MKSLLHENCARERGSGRVQEISGLQTNPNLERSRIDSEEQIEIEHVLYARHVEVEPKLQENHRLQSRTKEQDDAAV